jgi:hypothetical protein
MQVWQYMHSTCVKHLKKDGYSEVTGMVHILGRGLFLSVGWDRQITTFKDEPDVCYHSGWWINGHSGAIILLGLESSEARGRGAGPEVGRGGGVIHGLITNGITLLTNNWNEVVSQEEPLLGGC